MRRWLLAIVCILLVADAYWASRNLVLKDAGMRWINAAHFSLKFEKNPPEGDATSIGQPPKLFWSNGKWFAEGKEVADVKEFIQYYDGPHSSCGLRYYLEGDPSIEVALKSLKDAFSAGAEDVVILAPRVEFNGRQLDEVPGYAPPASQPTCPFAEQWFEHLSGSEHAYGYPPTIKSKNIRP